MTDINYQTVAEEAIAAGNIPAVIEIDRSRGVIWIHDATNGTTAIRMCGLPPGITVPIDMTIQPDGIMLSGTYMVELPQGPLVHGAIANRKGTDPA